LLRIRDSLGGRTGVVRSCKQHAVERTRNRAI
jgi:hypothetical protein